MEPNKVILPMEIMIRRMSKEKRKKRRFLMKLDLSTAISFELIRMLMIPKTALDTKKAPPRMLLRPTLLLDPVKETTLAKKSGAPLPRERRVTPAIVGGSLKILDKPSKELQK